MIYVQMIDSDNSVRHLDKSVNIEQQWTYSVASTCRRALKSEATMIRSIFLSVVLVLLIHEVCCSQFLSPLPNSLSQTEFDSLTIKKNYENANPGDTMTDSVLAEELEKDPGKSELRKRTSGVRRWLLKPALWHKQYRVYDLYSHESLLSFLSYFSGAISEDQAFINAELLSGIAGRVRISISSAFVVSRNDEGDPDSSAVVENRNTTVIGLVSNGGSYSLKIAHPFFAGGGWVQQHAAMAYINIGLLSGTSREERENPIGGLGVVGEYVSSIAVRSPSGESEMSSFDILLGVRAGIHYATERFLGFESRSVPFMQLMGGVRQTGSMKYTFVYTLVKNEFAEYVPKVVLNLQAATF